jgi:hypothetical protein
VPFQVVEDHEQVILLSSLPPPVNASISRFGFRSEGSYRLVFSQLSGDGMCVRPRQLHVSTLPAAFVCRLKQRLISRGSPKQRWQMKWLRYAFYVVLVVNLGVCSLILADSLKAVLALCPPVSHDLLLSRIRRFTFLLGFI